MTFQFGEANNLTPQRHSSHKSPEYIKAMSMVGCEVVFDGCKFGIVEEDLGDSVMALDEDGGTYLLSKSRIDSVTKLKGNNE